MKGHRHEEPSSIHPGAFAAICAAIASATRVAPRNFRAPTRSRAGPASATGAHARTPDSTAGSDPAAAAGAGSRGRAARVSRDAAAAPAERRNQHRSHDARGRATVGRTVGQSRDRGAPAHPMVRRPGRACAARADGRIYVRRFRNARREAGGRGAGPLHAIAFAGGMLALLAALVSPIDGLGADYLFSAHMVQHVLLGDIAPLLLLLSLSRVIMRPATRRLARVERALGPLASPWTAIVIWLGIMYLWHIPALYDAAAEYPLAARARAPLVLRRGSGSLVAAGPAGPDAQEPHRHAAARLHRAVQRRPRGARAVPGMELDRRTTRGTSTRRASGASARSRTRTWPG